MVKYQRLFCHQTQFQSGHVIFSAEQIRYLAKVLRLQATEHVIVMDGQGHWWMSELTSGCQSAALLDLLDINYELPVEVTLLAAPPKGKGFDDVIHGATELGVRHIYPLISERTQVHPSAQKLSRWQKIAIEASEQSLRQFVPTVHDPVDSRWIEAELQPNRGPILFCSTQPHRIPLSHALQDLGSIPKLTVMIGPEGGWSPQEERRFEQLQWQGVSLGQRVLRAVTAPICALSLISAFCEQAE